MLHGKQAPTKPTHRRKALPVLGAAGLSLSLAGATTAAAIGGPATDMLTRNAGVSHEINLSEEEIADVRDILRRRHRRRGTIRAGRPAGDGVRRLRRLRWLRRLLVEQRLPGADDLEQCRHPFGQPHAQSRTSAQAHIGSTIPVS
jgi:hypothetical protein